MDDPGFLSVRFFKNKAGRGRHFEFATRAIGHRGQQGDGDVGAIDLAVVIPDIAEVIGRFDDTHRGDGDLFFGPKFDDAHGRKRQVAQGHQGVFDAQLIPHFKRSSQLRFLHVQRLLVIADVGSAHPAAIHIEVHVDVVEGFEDVGHPASLVVIVNSIEHHVFDAHRLGRRNQTNHPIGNSYAKIFAWIYVPGLNMPGRIGQVLRPGPLTKCSAEQKSANRFIVSSYWAHEKYIGLKFGNQQI